MKMQQVTIRVEGFVTVTMPKGTVVPDDIPIKLDVFNSREEPGSKVIDVIETDITEKEISTTADITSIHRDNH
jgi:hypothetical protein